MKLDGDLAGRLLKQCSVMDEPTRANLAKTLRVDPRKVDTHLKALTQLFVLNRLDPHPSGVGKSMYLPFDSGLAFFMGASRERCLHICFLNEILIRQSMNQKMGAVYFYKSTGKKLIHLIEEDAAGRLDATQLIMHDSVKKTHSELMKAFIVKNKSSREIVSGTVYGPVEESFKLNEVQYRPWISFVQK